MPQTARVDVTAEPPSHPIGGGTDEARPSERARVAVPTGWTLLALIVALVFLGGAVGWTLGRGRPPGAGSADVGFLHDMRSHHENAISLAQIELGNGREQGAKVFAEEILRFQSYEIGLMDQLSFDWGHRPEDRSPVAMGWMGHPVAVDEMPGLASEDELGRFRNAGAETDAVFLALMIEHHEAGVLMAEAAESTVADDEVRALAARIASTQRAEIAEMESAAERLGLDPSPAGVDDDVDLDDGAHGSAHAEDEEHAEDEGH